MAMNHYPIPNVFIIKISDQMQVSFDLCFLQKVENKKGPPARKRKFPFE